MTERVKIKYWWSSDKKWFCILTDDGVNQATVSLTPEEAALLSMNAVAETDANAPGDTGLVSGVSSAPNHQPHAVSQGWRTDLENAPRDGTWFLTVNADEGADSFEVGKYDPYMTANFVEVGDNLFRKELRPSYDWTGFNNFHRATHWMPLPSPPSKEGE